MGKCVFLVAIALSQHLHLFNPFVGPITPSINGSTGRSSTTKIITHQLTLRRGEVGPDRTHEGTGYFTISSDLKVLIQHTLERRRKS